MSATQWNVAQIVRNARKCRARGETIRRLVAEVERLRAEAERVRDQGIRDRSIQLTMR